MPKRAAFYLKTILNRAVIKGRILALWPEGGGRGFHLTRLLGCGGHTWCDLLKQVDNEFITVMQMERRTSQGACLLSSS